MNEQEFSAPVVVEQALAKAGFKARLVVSRPDGAPMSEGDVSALRAALGALDAEAFYAMKEGRAAGAAGAAGELPPSRRRRFRLIG